MGKALQLMAKWEFRVLLLCASLMAMPSRWNALAASGKEHWAFNPVQSPTPPTVKDRTWARNSVDLFILSKLEQSKLSPFPPADRRTLIRRVTYDLTGLPPTVEDVEAFLADESPTAYEAVVNRLLASPAYGEHWGRRWLDVVRYADTAGETADFPVPDAWRYRNYVIDAFNGDKPYDEFIREQIAGDILAGQGDSEKYAERITATGFIALSRRFGFDSENYHHLTIQDTLDTIGQSVLGLSIGCARCHDHKYDPISIKEYYSLYGIFESTRYAFPGSEQKQKLRALVPLIPPRDSRPQWQAFESRVAYLTRRLEKQKVSPPMAVLRSLDEMDGDFEIQAPANGGSRGVLVPPWKYSGDVSATTDAQSPFRNLYPPGKVGVSISPGRNAAAGLHQALRQEFSAVQAGKIHINIDFKFIPQEDGVPGAQNLWIGHSAPDGGRSAAIQVSISARKVAMVVGPGERVLNAIHSNEWQNLQITLDFEASEVSGAIGRPGDVAIFREPVQAGWNGLINFIALESSASAESTAPRILVDNIGVRMTPIPPVSMHGEVPAEDGAQLDPMALHQELDELVGIDGDFEFQSEGLQPTTPWYPGPNSKVAVAAAGQSPFQNIYPRGSLGLAMPSGGAYDGFVLKLPPAWEPRGSYSLNASFDFRCANHDSAGEGSWRFYIGHGAGSAAAVELFFNDRSFFTRSGDSREMVSTIQLGEWYQVRLALDLKRKVYKGTINCATNEVEFSGAFAPGWDGRVDHLFIDSYGHIGGVRPGLFADNFAVTTAPLSGLHGPVVASDAGRDARSARREQLRLLMGELGAQASRDRMELEKLLATGPFAMAYGVVEGTPENARVQLRGEPDKPGDLVDRGFPAALAFSEAAPGLHGSGRLELGNWLVDPENPLTRRVIVNRIWSFHLRRGLVETPNDFGLRGAPPTHPELLDHLASRFLEGGWSIKEMQRLILLSATYRQASANAADPRDRTLFRGIERRRLTAEELRDSILFVSKAIDPSPGTAHPFPAPFSWSFSQHGPFNGVYDNSRRSVYLMQQRIKRHPFLELFDGPDPNASVAGRQTTTVPTQSLFFLNDPVVHRNSELLTDDLMAHASDRRQLVEDAWRRVLGRSPGDSEELEALDFMKCYEDELLSLKPDTGRHALAALVRTLIGSNEFLHID